MIQRYLFTAIKTGLDAVVADPTILDTIFQEQYALSDTEMDAIKTKFAADPPNVKHGFARSDDVFPLVAIILVDDAEGEVVLADDFGMIGDEEEDEDDENYGAEVLGSLWSASFQFLCYAEHSDVVLYLYELVKDILFTALPYFQTVGIHKLGISGADLMLDPRYVPAHLFGRRVTFRCRYEFSHLDKGSKLGKAFAVAGIHIDSSGSPRTDVGDVKTLVGTYQE